MKSALLVLACASTAYADAPRTCKPTGNVVFQLDQRVDKKVKLATATTRVYKNGAYVTQSYDRYRTLTSTDTGCLADEHLALLDYVTVEANFKTTPVEAPCTETSPRFSEIRVHGRLAFVDRRCNRSDVTREARAAIAELTVVAHIPTVDDVRRTGRRNSGTSVDGCSSNPLAKGCN